MYPELVQKWAEHIMLTVVSYRTDSTWIFFVFVYMLIFMLYFILFLCTLGIIFNLSPSEDLVTLKDVVTFLDNSSKKRKRDQPTTSSLSIYIYNANKKQCVQNTNTKTNFSTPVLEQGKRRCYTFFSAIVISVESCQSNCDKLNVSWHLMSFKSGRLLKKRRIICIEHLSIPELNTVLSVG
jgi:hypothetical protein